MSTALTTFLPDADATLEFGRELAGAISGLSGRTTIYLYGDLGAGKTTFSRGFIEGCGHTGRVPSPTYTLLEPYDVTPRPVYHMDLYRLQDGAELEFLGLYDLPESAIFLVEWPDKGEGELFAADILIRLALSADGRSAELSLCNNDIFGSISNIASLSSL